MCGIVGFITKDGLAYKSRRQEFLKQALIVDTVRGKDSTGVFGAEVVKEGEKADTAYWFKATTNGPDFVAKNKHLKEFCDELEKYKFVVGHNRHATIGSTSEVANAHPFQEGPITLVHNGTLDDMDTMPTKSTKLTDVEVDSHVICHNLAEHDAKEVLESIVGAYCLIWHDARDDSLNIVRNTHRPMNLAKVKNQNTLYFASEAEMLSMLLTRNKMDIETIVTPKVGQWLKFTSDIFNPEVQEVKTLPRRQYRGYSSYYDSSYYDRGWRSNNTRRHYNAHYAAPDLSSAIRTVRINGTYQTLPTTAEKALAREFYSPEDRLDFSPVSLEYNPGKDVTVVKGKLGYTGDRAVLIGQKRVCMANNFYSTQLVRPVGVKYDETGTPIIFCMLVALFFNENDRKFLMEEDYVKAMEASEAASWESEAVPAEVEDTDDVEVEDSMANVFTGPSGKYIDINSWLALTKKGCAWCAEQPDVDDSDDVIWLEGTANEFCCPDCAKESPTVMNYIKR